MWEDVFDSPSLINGEIRCPVCGQLVRPRRPVRAPGPSPRRRAQQGESLLSRRAALLEDRPSAVAGPPATVVQPALANQPKKDRLDASTPNLAVSAGSAIDGAAAPVWPSTRLQPDAAPPVQSPQAREWPTLPGYEILGELGRGGMGVVYKARQVGLNRFVALKMILSADASRRPSSASAPRPRLSLACRTRTSCRSTRSARHDGQPFFSLEYLEGGSLADNLGPANRWHRGRAGLVETLARAVHFAHERGVVHRDLKPANMLLQEERGPRPGTGWQPVLRSENHRLRPRQTLDQDVHNTRSGTVVGTPGYMAPEQAVGQKDVAPGRTFMRWASCSISS